MNSKVGLSQGALEIIMNGGNVSEPIMQVLNSKKVVSGNTERGRYRIFLSDGKYTISSAMLTTQTNDTIGSEGIKNNSIIRIKRYITSMIKSVGRGDTRILLILEMEVIEERDEMIGSPIPLNDDNTSTTSKFTNVNGAVRTSGVSTSPYCSLLSYGTLSSAKISPIAALNPFHNGWVIKARVSSKSVIRTWSNSQGNGKLFTMDLVDKSGEIRCTFFRELADKFYNHIEANKIYYVSKCQLKPRNQTFCNLNHTFEMVAVNDSVIEEYRDEDYGIPRIKYDFISLGKIPSMEVGTFVDVIGICTTVSDLQIFTAKASSRELKKREVILVDQSKIAVSLTLWAFQAENFDAASNSVISVKNAKICEFAGGKFLQASVSSQITINPEIPESYQIKQWFNLEGTQIEFKDINSSNGINNFKCSWMRLKEVYGEDFSPTEKGFYYQVMATVLFVRSENCVYKACPVEQCNKKVVDLENGMFRCDKCNREFAHFKYRLITNMNICDSTCNRWVTVFSSEAEKIIGKTSEEVGKELENNPDEVMKMFGDIHFKQFVFKCRAKMETYNDEQRLKTVVIKADPVNYEEYSSYLVEKIRQYVS